jgi:hypothetical protein
MRVKARGVFAPVLPLIPIAVLALSGTAIAQTTVFLNVPDSQVVDSTIRNGPYATRNLDTRVLLTRPSTIPDWERRTVISVDTSVIPNNTTITSATLRLTVKSGLGSSGATRPVSAYRLVSYFREQEVTWLNRIPGTAWPTPGGDLGELIGNATASNTVGARVTFNLTSLVQRAVNNQLASRLARVVLIDVGGGGDAKDSYREYHSSEAAATGDRPQLTVTYGSVDPGSSSGVINVPRGGDLQSALNQVQPGGTIRLESGATYVGNFTLPAKSSTSYVTLTTGGVTLPPAGTRIDPSYRSRLATIRSSNGAAALRTATGASYYRIVGVAFESNVNGDGDVMTFGSDAQTTLTRFRTISSWTASSSPATLPSVSGAGLPSTPRTFRSSTRIFGTSKTPASTRRRLPAGTRPGQSRSATTIWRRPARTFSSAGLTSTFQTSCRVTSR